jgi:hypothetical protein
MQLEAYARLITARIHFGHHAKCSSVAWKYLQIMHAENAACYRTPIPLAANAAGCMPHAPILVFMKSPKLLQAYYASTVFELLGT